MYQRHKIEGQFALYSTLNIERRKKMSQEVFKETKEKEIQIFSLKNTLPLRRLSVSEYHRMGEEGILKEDEHVELIDGALKEMSPKGTLHSAVVGKLSAPFYELVIQNKVLLRVQDPVVLTDNTEPEPDLALVKPREDAYMEMHPRPDDVLLLIEVAETSPDKKITVSRIMA